MYRLLGREVFPEKSELLFDLALDRPEDLEQFECASGEWTIENGALTGRCRENGGGLCYTKQSWPGDILISFYGLMLPPCRNDLNFSIKTEGWDYARNDAARGFIGGLNGWYDDKAGIEKYPQCKTQALLPFHAESGREYFIEAGYAVDTVFLCVDGRLVLELHDPNPEEFAALGRVGLGTYCSQVRFRKLSVYRLASKAVAQSYTPNF